MIDIGILTLLFGLVVANFLKCHFMVPLWWRDIFPNFCVLLCRYDATNGYRFTFGLGSRYVGHSSVLIPECVGRLQAIQCYVGLDYILNRPWIGVRSPNKCPIHNWSKTDKPSTIGSRPTRPRNAPWEKNDTTPTYNRQTTDNLSGRDFSNMFEWSLPDKFVCPNINWHQSRQNRINTDCKPISPRIWWFLSVWGRFRVGLVGVTGVLLASCKKILSVCSPSGRVMDHELVNESRRFRSISLIRQSLDSHVPSMAVWPIQGLRSVIGCYNVVSEVSGRKSQMVRAFSMNPKVGGSSPPQVETFSLKNFYTFTRTSVRVSKMNVDAHAQLTFQMLSSILSILILFKTTRPRAYVASSLEALVYHIQDGYCLAATKQL